MNDRETTNAKNAGDAVTAIRQLAREEISRGGVADRVLVEAVAGNAIKVRALGSDVPGAQLIPISGFVPAVGSEVLLIRTFGGQLVALPLTSLTLGTGAGQVPTTDQVQQKLFVYDGGVLKVTNPGGIEMGDFLLVTPQGNGYRLDTVMPLSGLSNVSTTTPATGQLLRWNGTSWAPYTLPAATGKPSAVSTILRTFSGSLSSSTFGTLTNTSGTIGVLADTVYDITLWSSYTVLPGSTGTIEGQLFMANIDSGPSEASGETLQSLVNGHAIGSYNTGSATSIAFGFRARSTGGTHAFRNGAILIHATPR